MMIFTEAVKSKVCHLAAVCTMSAYRQLCTVLDDDDDSAVALQTILAQENIRGGTCCWEKSISCLRKFPMNPNQGYVKRIFHLSFTNIQIFKHPQAAGNIFMSFTPLEKQISKPKKSIRE